MVVGISLVFLIMASNIASDACEPGLERRSEFDDLAPTNQADSPAGNFSTHFVSAQLESGDSQDIANPNLNTPAVDSLPHTASSIDSGSSRQVTDDSHDDVIFKPFMKDGQSFVRVIFKKEVSESYKHLVTFVLRQRCLWLVPVLDMRDVPFEHFQVICPDTLDGSLENRMSQGMAKTKQDDVRAKAIRIAYQILEGISFLHLRNVVHGDINSSNVLLDQYENARLTNYGMYRAYCAEELARTHQLDASHRTVFDEFINADKCFTHDLWQFASLLLQFLNSDERLQSEAMSYLTKSLSVLKQIRKLCSTHSTVKFQQKGRMLMKESFDYKEFTQNACSNLASGTSLEVELKESAGEVLVSKSFDLRYFIDNYVDKRTWLTDDITYEVVHVLIKCLWMRCDRSTASGLAAEMRSIMKKRHLPRVCDDQKSEICRYCTVEPIHSELQLRRTSCPERCQFLRACSSCMPLFGLCHVYNADNSNSDGVENVCPDHGSKHAGGLNSDSVENICPDHQCRIEPVIGGQRSYAMILNHGEYKNDAMRMLQLATHPKIMQMPCSNVFRITIRDGVKCLSRVVSGMKQILDANPTYFLFYYSGHEMVLADNKGKVRPEYANLVQILKRFITGIAKVCPRFLRMFDCCYAAAVAELFEVKLDDDTHVEWHAVWVSSKRNQTSNVDIPLGHRLSRFTELVVSALNSATVVPCPSHIEKCNACSTFRESLKNGCITIMLSNL